MESLIAVAGFIFAAAVTPGPNNVIVMAAAARAGLAGAVPAIGGILAGSLTLLALVWAGADTLFEAVPALRGTLLAAGVLYLLWLGGGLIWRSGGGDIGNAGNTRTGVQTLPASVLGVAVFQILNPKAWVLVMTATVAMPNGETGLAGLGGLAAMMVVIPAACLMLWAGAGAVIADRLRQPVARRRFDRSMGSLLIVTAVLLAGGPALAILF